MELTQQQRHWQRFYNDFGFIRLPGLFAAERDWISQEFERVFLMQGITHDGTKRTGCGYLVESSVRLCSLLEDPRLDSVLTAILGEDYNYLGSAGELYVGDGMWHPDGVFPTLKYAKLAMYLDPLTPETGALRLVPGSHLQGWEGNLDTQALWGMTPYEVPYASYNNTPGDVIIFNLNTLHNSLGGGYRRRMLNMGFSSHAGTEEEVEHLKGRLSSKLYSDLLLTHASPNLMKHLRQPLELQGQRSVDK
jgi:hypothetical protein